MKTKLVIALAGVLVGVLVSSIYWSGKNRRLVEQHNEHCRRFADSLRSLEYRYDFPSFAKGQNLALSPIMAGLERCLPEGKSRDQARSRAALSAQKLFGGDVDGAAVLWSQVADAVQKRAGK